MGKRLSGRLVGAATVALLASVSSSAATFTVTSAADAGPGSLRQAILDANGSAGPHLIVFAIPGTGVHTIAPLAPLPPITSANVTIDGYTQAGASANTDPYRDNAALRVEIDGTSIPTETGLILFGSSGTVQGLVVGGFATGIDVIGSGGVVAGCFVGTTADGMHAHGNTIGIYVAPTCTSTRIGDASPAARNVIPATASAPKSSRSWAPVVLGSWEISSART